MSRLNLATEPGGRRLQWLDRQGGVLGSLLLVPRLGLGLPRYHFHVGRVVHAAAELRLFRVLTTLLLGNDHTGQSELAELYWAPGLGETERAEVLARLIAAARAEIAAQPAEFGDSLVAELPGWRDASGVSPFWQGLGARLFPGDPRAAEARLGAAWRSHLAALLPRQTVYLSFLGAAAEAHLAEPDEAHRPARSALLAAGFQPASHVRIDDGGPVLTWRIPRA